MQSMNRLSHRIAATLALAAVFGSGCHPTQPFYFREDGDLSHYVGMATEIEDPVDSEAALPDARYASAPLTLDNANFGEIWELSLAETIKIAMANSKVLRNLGGRTLSVSNGSLTPSDQLLSNPDNSFRTIYDPALQESSAGVTNGLSVGTGPEAALAAFDTQLTSSFFWEKNDNPLNIDQANFGILGFPTATVQDIGTFQAQLQKTNATGLTTILRTTTTYDQSNDIRRLFPSEYRTNIEGEFRLPLLQGSGVEYNRIAGPFSPLAGIGTRTFDGVVIARIQTDRALADFEAGVRNMVSDVHNAYWGLYYAYRNLEARKVGLTSSLKTWQTVQAITEAGGIGGGREREALAREQYFSFRAQTETAKSDVFAAENRLRYMMGIAATDGRLIRPFDDPILAKVTFEWNDILGESLSRNVELRKQKWRIKQRELELIAARNHLMPRLDAVGSQSWNGFGDDLISANGGGKGRFDNAVNNLLHGDFQESQLGIQFSMNIGFRAELAAVRNAQLAVTRDQAILHEQELELSHLLATAVRDLDRHYQLIETNFNRRVAAQSQVDTFQAKLDVGFGRNIEQLDLLLDAQRRLAQAEVDYYASLVDYNRAISQIQFRKGSLLEDNNVFLAEGPWPAKAYFDAKRIARQRDASIFIDNGLSRPNAVSQGTYQQHTRPQFDRESIVLDQDPADLPESIPSPNPETLQPDVLDLPDFKPPRTTYIAPETIHAPQPKQGKTARIQDDQQRILPQRQVNTETNQADRIKTDPPAVAEPQRFDSLSGRIAAAVADQPRAEPKVANVTLNAPVAHVDSPAKSDATSRQQNLSGFRR